MAQSGRANPERFRDLIHRCKVVTPASTQVASVPLQDDDCLLIDPARLVERHELGHRLQGRQRLGNELLPADCRIADINIATATFGPATATWSSSVPLTSKTQIVRGNGLSLA